MGSSYTTTLQEDEILQIEEDTGFTRKQIVRLHHRFTILDQNGDGLVCTEDFLKIPKLAVNPLATRLIYLFCNSEDDTFESHSVNFTQFVRILSKFRPNNEEKKRKEEHNSRLEKLRFVFKLYDLENNDKISKPELTNVLHMMLGSNVPDDQLADIADRTFSEVDADHDGFISFDEYVKAMHAVDLDQMSVHFLG